ncbi:sorting nexin-8 [Pimephales promelas]|uniref:sorting nexin-8 n=1 Tax=Pimephales promelas TaxID=90988 RepID=UPI001955C798|nr:sorting nexin-8 [Pimephales promelas]KAG1927717.1 sorting nexin-8 [Pimephales promelas]KAG1927718.1 sorting nexin-8 [Pimephales promelas]
MHLGQQSALVDGLSLKELGDSVLVEIEPQRKGLSFLKHVEYRIVSKCFQIPVQRRYKDFEMFHGLLLQKFIYRMVPSLPPKRILKGVLNSVSDQEFNDSRRRGLQRFMTLVIRHPVLVGDELVNIFLSASSADVLNKMRDAYKKTGDEFLTSQIALHGKVNLPEGMQSQAAANREVIASIHSSFNKLRDVAERIAQRSRENSTDLLMFGKDLSELGSDTPDLPVNATMSKAWKTQRKSLGELSGEFGLLADKAAHQGSREEDEVVEKLNLLLELLQSYKDLCDRHDSGVLLEHQRAFEKRSGPVATHLKYQSNIEQSRLTQQENTIITMEMRSYFSLLCLHQETQMVFTHLPLVTSILGTFVHSQLQGHKEMGDVWGELHPKLKDLFESVNEPSSRSSSQTHHSRGQNTCALIGPA